LAGVSHGAAAAGVGAVTSGTAVNATAMRTHVDARAPTAVPPRYNGVRASTSLCRIGPDFALLPRQ
jgi:hypothetical protein